MRQRGRAGRGGPRRPRNWHLHDDIAREDPDLVQVLPAIRFTRSYWLLTPDTRDLRSLAEVQREIVDRVKAAQRSLPVA